MREHLRNFHHLAHIPSSKKKISPKRERKISTCNTHHNDANNRDNNKEEQKVSSQKSMEKDRNVLKFLIEVYERVKRV